MYIEAGVFSEFRDSVISELHELRGSLADVREANAQLARENVRLRAALAESRANEGRGERAWLSAAETATKLGTKSLKTIRKWRSEGTIPRHAWKRQNARVFLYARSWVEARAGK